MSRHSGTGTGFGFAEAMVLEFERMSSGFGRVVVGVAVHQDGGPRVFGDMAGAGVLVGEGYRQLPAEDFAGVADATAAQVAEFSRDASGAWELHESVREFDSDPVPCLPTAASPDCAGGRDPVMRVEGPPCVEGPRAPTRSGRPLSPVPACARRTHAGAPGAPPGHGLGLQPRRGGRDRPTGRRRRRIPRSRECAPVLHR